VTRGAICSDDDIRTELQASGQREALEPGIPDERCGGTAGERFSACCHRCVAQCLVELSAWERHGVVGVGVAREAGPCDASRGRAHHDHVAHGHCSLEIDSEIREKLDAARSDEISARFVARELRLVDDRNPRAAPRQHGRSDAPAWPRADDQRVEAARVHRVSST
jgi:hypothetical protein